MKFTLSWLKEHLETSASPQELAEKLTWLGLEVESLTDRAGPLKSFIVAEVVSAERHPSADRLQVCIVNTGKEKLQVVCGAPNARAGLRGVFAPAGTHVPGTGLDLKVTSIRGVESNGMMCSEKELCLSEESDGIIELPADAPLGQSFVAYKGLDDPLFELKLTPNRPDCAGVAGIARDLAAAGMGKLKTPKIDAVKGKFDSSVKVNLDKQSACPYFIGRFIRGVKNRPSPEWLQRKLNAIGLKPISALVDITNYLTFDRARPLHVFDASKLKGSVQVRLARAGEKIKALNGKEYTLDNSITVIADEMNAQAIAGIIGGEESGCGDATTDVFLECAYFDPASTTLAGRKLGITSDARFRFERGVDPAFMPSAEALATKLILEICGGEASAPVIAGAQPPASKPVLLRTERCKTFGGLDIDVKEQEKLLQAVGCTVKKVSQGLEVTFPSFRPDMEGEADCIEEILRLKGYEAVQPVSMPAAFSMQHAAYSFDQKRRNTIRRALAARGLLETVGWSFTSSPLAAKFGEVPESLHLQNPISAELDVMRPSLLPGLLQAAARNAARSFTDAALFEVGPVYHSPEPQGQTYVAASLRSGQIKPRQWAESARAVDWADAKADALAALEAAGAPVSGLQAAADAPAHYHPGRSGNLRLGANVLASFGEIHPALLKAMDIVGAVAACEVFFERIPASRSSGPTKSLVDLNPLQPVKRDFAFVLAADIPADKLLKAVRGVDKALITNAEIFDLYEGDKMEAGKKSLALSVTLQPREKSLTDAEIEALSAKIIAAAAKATGASLR
jgi:phenylalanyl-tRNA synthetase beta chain